MIRSKNWFQLFHFPCIWRASKKMVKGSFTYFQYPPPSVWPDCAIYCTLGIFSKPVAAIILPKKPKFLGNFCKMLKSFIFLGKSFLGKFYGHLATFYWSHWLPPTICRRVRVHVKPKFRNKYLRLLILFYKIRAFV